MATAAARSGGGDAPSTGVNQRAVDFRRQLDEHTRTLVESFGRLLRSAKITNPQSVTREEFQVNVATASLATAGEGLLRQIREVKLAVMLQDEAAMDREVDQALARIAGERAELEKELEALSNELKAAYAVAATAGRGGAVASAERRSEVAPAASGGAGTAPSAAAPSAAAPAAPAAPAAAPSAIPPAAGRNEQAAGQNPVGGSLGDSEVNAAAQEGGSTMAAATGGQDSR